jgi:protease I
VVNADHLRVDKDARAFARAFFEQHKPVAAICHGPWLLIDAEVVRGRKMTSYHTLETDLRNAGAIWSDQEVVVDQGLVTSRKPRDLPAFNRKLLEEIAEGKHTGQTV